MLRGRRRWQTVDVRVTSQEDRNFSVDVSLLVQAEVASTVWSSTGAPAAGLCNSSAHDVPFATGSWSKGSEVVLWFVSCDALGHQVAHSLPSASDPREYTAELQALNASNASSSGIRVQYLGGGTYSVYVTAQFLGDCQVVLRLDEVAVASVRRAEVACPEPLVPLTPSWSAMCVCPLGFESSVDGSCVPCREGTVKAFLADEAGRLSTCTECPVRTWSSAGATACSYCAPGRANDQVGQAACDRCAAGTFSGVGFSNCLLCGAAGGDGPGGSDEGINCTGGIVRGTMPGFWSFQPLDASSANETRTWPCDPPEACEGGAAWPACRQGHGGVLCASCLANYSLDRHGLCQRHESGAAAAVSIALAIMFVLAAICALVGLCWKLSGRTGEPHYTPPWEAADPARAGNYAYDDN